MKFKWQHSATSAHINRQIRMLRQLQFVSETDGPFSRHSSGGQHLGANYLHCNRRRFWEVALGKNGLTFLPRTEQENPPTRRNWKTRPKRLQVEGHCQVRPTRIVVHLDVRVDSTWTQWKVRRHWDSRIVLIESHHLFLNLIFLEHLIVTTQTSTAAVSSLTLSQHLGRSFKSCHS